MRDKDNLIGRSLVSGTVAGIATAVAASAAGKRDAGSYTAPLNATSHIFWGDQAARQNRPSWKYTASGFLLNHAASIMWAAIYEKWFASSRSASDSPSTVVKPLAGAAVVAAGAYITDYYLIPKRVTPGFEMRLSGTSMAIVFGVLAMGIAARSLFIENDSP